VKLLFQVLFLQGYLWRDRFPAYFREGGIAWYNGDVVLLSIGLIFTTAGISVLAAGWVIAGMLILMFGAGFVLGNAQRLGLNRLGGSDAFWVSLEWSGGTLTVLGTLGIILRLILVGGWWPVTLLFLLILFFPEAPGIRRTWERYLFFADPAKNRHFLEDPISRNPLTFWFDTFFRLPWQVAKAIFHGSPMTTR
jgi:hypothetical protein